MGNFLLFASPHIRGLMRCLIIAGFAAGVLSASTPFDETAADLRSSRVVRAPLRNRYRGAARGTRQASRHAASILDLVSDDTHRLESNLGAVDRRKLDEYLSSVREIEQMVERSEKEGMMIDPGMEKPFGVPPEFDDYFRPMTDMLIVAFKADLTRIATLLIGREGSTRSYREIGISDGHHPLDPSSRQPGNAE